MDLTNTVALITGGKRIGRVVAEALAARGADVALTYARSRAEAEEAAARVRAASRRGAAYARRTFRSRQRRRGAGADGRGTFGRLDVLVNMASVYVRRPFAT